MAERTACVVTEKIRASLTELSDPGQVLKPL